MSTGCEVAPARRDELTRRRYQIIPRPMFDHDHLACAYNETMTPHAHKLACVFLVLATGVLFDLNRQPCKGTPARTSLANIRNQMTLVLVNCTILV